MKTVTIASDFTNVITHIIINITIMTLVAIIMNTKIIIIINNLYPLSIALTPPPGSYLARVPGPGAQEYVYMYMYMYIYIYPNMFVYTILADCLLP